MTSEADNSAPQDQVNLAGGGQTFWQVEMWRISREVIPVTLFSLALVGFFQVVFVFMANQSIGTAVQTYLQYLYVAPGFAGLIFVLGLICLQFGIEREQGSWHWRTSLPVPWAAEALSKLVALLVGALICFLLSLGIAGLLDNFVAASLNEQSTALIVQQRWQFAVNVIQAIPILVLALLVCEQILSGLLLGVIGGFVVEVVRAGMEQQIGWSQTWAWGGGTPVWWMTHGILILVATAAAIAIYRFRWQQGLFWEWSWHRSTSVRRPVHLESRPGFWWSHSWLTLVQSRLLVVTFLALVSLFVLTDMFASRSPTPLVVRMLVLGFPVVLFLMAMAVFGNDRSRNRIRFYSDRGVSPRAYWATRIVPILALVTVGVAVCSWRAIVPTDLTRFAGVMPVVAVFAAGFLSFLLARLTFDNWAVASGVGLLLTFFGFLLVEIHYHSGGAWGVLLGMATILSVTLIVSLLQVKEVMRHWHPRTLRWLVSGLGVTVLISLAAYPLMRAYMVPMVNLPREAEAAAAQVEPIGIPDLSGVELPSLTELRKQAIWNPDIPFDEHAFRVMVDSWDHDRHRPDPDYANFFRDADLPATERQEIRDELNQIVGSSLEEIQAALEGPPVTKFRYDSFRSDVEIQLRQASVWTAELFFVAVMAHDAELAKQALQINFQLYEQPERFYGQNLLVWGYDAIPVTQWHWLLSQVSLEDLLPPEPISRQEMINSIARVYDADRRLTLYGQPDDPWVSLTARRVLSSRRNQFANRSFPFSGFLPEPVLTMGSPGFLANSWWERERGQRLAKQAYARAFEIVQDGQISSNEYPWSTSFPRHRTNSFSVPEYEYFGPAGLNQPQYAAVAELADRERARQRYAKRIRELAESAGGSELE